MKCRTSPENSIDQKPMISKYSMVFNNSSSYAISKAQVLRVWFLTLLNNGIPPYPTPNDIQAPSYPGLLWNFGINFRSQVVNFFSFFLSNSNAWSPLVPVQNAPPSDSSLSAVSGPRDSPGRAVFRQTQWLDVMVSIANGNNETYGDNDQQ